ncbi:RIO1 family regulatory kinase/ATPase, partial [Halobium palmae]
MDFRRFVRGAVDWSRLEAVARELARRYGREEVHVRFLEADNWLSTPMVVEDEWFVKVVSRQNSVVHALFTTGRNLGAFSSGTEGFFEHFGTPLDMAEHELEATERMREIGVNAPAPVEAFEVDGLGVLVLEYLPAFRSLDQLEREREREIAPRLFDSLRRLHEDGLAHGDLRAENVLIRDGELYFIDATNVRRDAAADARSYDLACAL